MQARILSCDSISIEVPRAEDARSLGVVCELENRRGRRHTLYELSEVVCNFRRAMPADALGWTEGNLFVFNGLG